MKLIKVKERMIFNIDKAERVVALRFDETKLQPVLLLEGLGEIDVQGMTFDEVYDWLKGMERGEA